jgi:hypothetical protein
LPPVIGLPESAGLRPGALWNRGTQIIQGHDEANMLGLAEAMAANPVRKLVSAIDLGAWLGGLSEND